VPQHPAYEAVKPSLPTQPGIYKYSDGEGTVIYVGKAKNLKRRVSSYFTKTHDSGRTRMLVKNIKKVDFTIVETEQDALLLENAMIKKLQPKYNVLLKDDKTYPYICIKRERFPRVFLTRTVIRDGSTYLGPFTSVGRVREILNFLKELYPLRTCSLKLSKPNIAAHRFKVCLEYHLGNCLGPCENHQSEENYMKGIDQITKILKGNFGSVTKYLKDEMQHLAADYKFEEAEKFKVRLQAIEKYQAKSTIVNVNIHNVDVFGMVESENFAVVSYFKIVNGTIIQTKLLELKKKLEETKEELLQIAIADLRTRLESNSDELIIPFEMEYPDKSLKVTVPQIGDKKKLLLLAEKNARYYRREREKRAKLSKTAKERNIEVLQQMKKDFRLTELPRHIECFDNSNFHGTNPVASMVLFRDGKPSKKEYRKYKIKTVVGSNDFASMKEVVFRRYNRLLFEEEPLPQLVIVDGGKGQLNAGLEALEELGLRGKVPIVGIAKRLEEIYVPDDPLPLYIDKRSSSLKLAQQLRNEAHRFAINFHRSLRSKENLDSEFTNIPGIGAATTNKLLTHFKSAQKIKEASLEELEKVVDKRKAGNVFRFFRGE